jgi:acyl dehydratase
MVSRVPVAGVDELRELTGRTIGPTPWVLVDQQLVNRFTDVSGDHFWIHVDPERAAKEGPFGTTIAFGDLTLVMLNGLREQLFEYENLVLGINYGWERVRYPSHVPVGSRIRMDAEILSVDDLDDDWLHVITRLRSVREGDDKPVCVADGATRLLFADRTFAMGNSDTSASDDRSVMAQRRDGDDNREQTDE